MSTCFSILQYWSDTTKADVNLNVSSVQTATGESPRPKSFHSENCRATVYEGLLLVTDMANRTGLWLEKNETETTIKGIHVRNGFKPCYLLPRRQMETHALLCLAMDKNSACSRTIHAAQEKDDEYQLYFANILFYALTLQLNQQ